MLATHRVKNHYNKTVGFIVDNIYRTCEYVTNKIGKISNLTIDKNGTIKIKQNTQKLKEVTKKDLNILEYKRICAENPLVRDIQKEFDYWREHNKDRIILYVTGARQVGKTTEILKFGYKNYENVIYINLANDANKKRLLTCMRESDYMMNDVIKMYCYGREGYSDDRRTVLIIDEIQESKKIYNYLRDFRKSLHCDIIITGSYLGVTINKGFFHPAGDYHEVKVLTLSFREFCRAFNLEKLVLSIDLFGNSHTEQYKTLTEKYEVYKEIGGYPSVVSTYMRGESIDYCKSRVIDILNVFINESSVYFKSDKCRSVFSNVFRAAILSMAKEKKGTEPKNIDIITSFIIEDTKTHVTRAEVNKAISWLEYAGIIKNCNIYNQGVTSDILSNRRYYFMDCRIASNLISNYIEDNRVATGLLTETFAYDELYRVYQAKKVKGEVPYCSVYKDYELDFMVMCKDSTKIGIEVKSSNSNNPKSLMKYIEDKLIDKAYLAGLTRGGNREAKGYKTIPIYTIGCRFPYE